MDKDQFQHMFAGLTGGVFSTLLLHPLDLLKIRFAVNDGITTTGERAEYSSLRRAWTYTIKTYGWRGLYQGVIPNCAGAGVSWGSYFFYYNMRKRSMQTGESTLRPYQHMIAAAESGIVSLVVSNPIWVVKTRMCLQMRDFDGKVPDSKKYTGLMNALGKIWKYEGIKGLYKGFAPGLVGVFHGSLQFMAYEELKRQVNVTYKKSHPSDKLTTSEYLGCAAISKVFAATLTYPYQVVRARLQDQNRDWGGLREILRYTSKYEGVRGFYRGLAPYILHVLPNICIVFITYEAIVNYLAAPPTPPSTTKPAAQKTEATQTYARKFLTNDDQNEQSPITLDDMHDEM